MLKIKQLGVAIGICAALAAAPAMAAGTQQERMKACNTEAADKKGDERKAFMKQCLSDKAAAAKSARTAQQEKMKACNVTAKKDKLAGDKRKAFMKDCLSKKA
jgi:hypothetical protein